MSQLNQTVNGVSLREIKEGDKMYSCPRCLCLRKNRDACGQCGEQPYAKQYYTPELWTIRKDYIYAAQGALADAIEYIKECQATHEANLGETTLKNRMWADRMRADLLKTEQALDNIQQPEGAQP